MKNNKTNRIRKHWHMAAVLLIAGSLICAQPLAVLADETLVVSETPTPSPAPETPTPAPETPTPTPETPAPDTPQDPQPGDNTGEIGDGGNTNTGNGEENPNADNDETDPNADNGETDPNANNGETDPTAETGETDPNAENGDTDPTAETGETDPAAEDGEAESKSEEENADGEKKEGEEKDGEEDEEKEGEEEDEEEEEEDEEEEEEEEEEKLFACQVTFAGEGKGSVVLAYADDEGNKIEVPFSPESNPAVKIKKDTVVHLIHKEDKESTFEGWKVTKGTAGIKDDSFTMPEGDVVIEATFKPIEEEGASKEAQAENAKRPRRTNAELIAMQHIQALPVPARDFRFWTVAANTQVVKAAMPMHEDISDGSRVIANLPANGVVNVLEEVDRDWLYVESGRARGFIRKDSFVSEGEKNAILASFGQPSGKQVQPGSQGAAVESAYPLATLTVPESENEAFLYRKCTAEQTVIDKLAVTPAGKDISILEAMDKGARACGTLGEGTIAYLLTEVDDDWVYVESGNVRGFVQRKDLHVGSAALADIRKAGGEDACETCAQLVAPEENKATYYTLTSIKAGTPTNPVREAIIKSAEQCLGHPYVWGGTDLLNGCDCSSFVQGLYSIYGITIPRVAENQAEFGRQIPVDNAIPGDLIILAKDGYVYHVALYVGNDQTIEAYSTSLGIIRNMVDHANAVWATRVIED